VLAELALLDHAEPHVGRVSRAPLEGVRSGHRAALRRCGFSSLAATIPLAYRWEGAGAVDDGPRSRADTRIHFTVGDPDFV
jgi:hypothetical protein